MLRHSSTYLLPDMKHNIHPVAGSPLGTSGQSSTTGIPQRTLRKRDKTGEVIWTHELDACIVEALRASDRNHDAQSATRCKYVSTYIYKKTGVVRTPAQVSSRIQTMNRGAGEDLRKVLDKGKRKSPAKNFFRLDSPSPAPNQSDQSLFMNYPLQENSPASTSETFDYGAPQRQSMQLGDWPVRDTESYPHTPFNIETSTGQLSNAPFPDADFQFSLAAADVSNINQLYAYPHYYNPMTATMGQGMDSSAYGSYPVLPNVDPVNPFYTEQSSVDSSYQNQQVPMAYPYFNGMPSSSGQVTYNMDEPFTQYPYGHRAARHTG